MEEPHRMRITSGGDMSRYMKFALSFLRDNDRPLVLHTLPPDNPVPTKSKSNGKSSMQSCTLSAPRLVSVVERIKREFKGELWQYTESGVLPSPKEAVTLEHVLGGKTKAYLLVTISKIPLGLEKGEKGRNITCQHVLGPQEGQEVEGEGDDGEKEQRDPGTKAAKRKSDAVPPVSKRARVTA